MTLWDVISDREREVIVEEIVGALPTSAVPYHLRAGLVRYFADGILPGSFLQAVLCNDLTQSVKRADPLSTLFAIPALIDFLLAVAPSQAWGSRDAVLSWTTTPDRLEV
jgi:hypothetical protein